MKRPNIRMGLDPHDPTKQVWHIGDLPPVRLGETQAREIAALALKLADQQARHKAGARIVLPSRIERLQ